MADQDLIEINATEPTRLVGSNPDGSEKDPIGSSDNHELFTYDVANSGGQDTLAIFNPDDILELKIGASAKVGRKYIVLQAKDKDFTWGFSPTTQSFEAFKNQFFILPFGPGTSVYIKWSGTAGTGIIGIGEA